MKRPPSGKSSALLIDLRILTAMSLAVIGGWASVSLPLSGDGFLTIFSVPLTVMMTVETMSSLTRRWALIRWRRRT